MKFSEQDYVALLQAVGAANVEPGLRQLLLREWFCWKWTTQRGKYTGCRYWSARALDRFTVFGYSGLRHEHIVPRAEVARILEAKLTANSGALLTANEWMTWLRRMCAGCVITEDENRYLGGHLSANMPEGWDQSDPWARYRQAFQSFGITVWEVDSKSERVREEPELSVGPPGPTAH